MKFYFRFTVCISLLVAFVLLGGVVRAQSNQDQIDQLKDQINDRTDKIQALEKEIDQYQKELDAVGEEKDTLQSAIRSLDLSQDKIQAEKNVTENQISATTFQISKLALEIQDQEQKIDIHNATLAESIRSINEADETTFIEQLLATGELSDLWEQVDDLQRFQTTLRASLAELKSLKADLESSKDEREARRRELLNYNQDLEEQNQAIGITKNEKNTLLTQTKNKESNYQDLLAEKQAARAQFEQELLEFESQLKIAIDPSSIPTPNTNILSSPVDHIRITQYFGDTEFAKTGAYDGKGHNGVDFGVPIGTRIKAALSGTVAATGNTDAIPGCYSYGKWVLIRHNNGLSTLYAHLSQISLGEGATVVTGQTIGYSGNTGYSTGPHLHFGLFATQGVKVVRLGDIKTITHCAEAYVPVAPFEAYLNPLQYLDVE